LNDFLRAVRLSAYAPALMERKDYAMGVCDLFVAAKECRIAIGVGVDTGLPEEFDNWTARRISDDSGGSALNNNHGHSDRACNHRQRRSGGGGWRRRLLTII
jgi:hypothetical protein